MNEPRYLFDGPEGPGCHAPVDVYAAGGRLLSLRLSKGWSVTYLSDVAGVKDAVTRRAEKGSFSLVNMLKIANALGAQLDYILYGEGES